MHYWICTDDTDMPGTIGTGRLLQGICRELEEQGLGRCSAISRHQLFVHEDIPFTSHNSSMCFEMHLATGKEISGVIGYMAKALETRVPRGADPGLCVSGPLTERAGEQLEAFGAAAKTQVLHKEDAAGLARELGLHLSEHGGTGGGIIGALAGVGLRMSGNDGRYRGWHHLGNPGDVFRVEALCRHPFIDRLVTESGKPLPMAEQVHIGSEKTKTVRMGHQRVVVVKANDMFRNTGIACRTITKAEARRY